MILSSHAIVGAAIARVLPTHPFLAFGLGVMSHLLLDAIPHWQYPLRSVQRSTGSIGNRALDRHGPHLYHDMFLVAGDALLGILVGWLIFPPVSQIGIWTSALTIFGSLLPDGLTFLYVWEQPPSPNRGGWEGWHIKPLAYFRRFHLWFHARDRRLENNPALGIPLQIAIIAIVAFAIYFFHP